VDAIKDQSYFLASIRPEALEKVLFPLGAMRKAEVRQLAEAYNLAPAAKRSSAGICFIGRRNFADFLAEYIPPMPATFVDVDTGKRLGNCTNLLSLTHGQRAGLGGHLDRVYVAGKDVVSWVRIWSILTNCHSLSVAVPF
jgi:tRNA-5-taurinomethyluridine 2-sulfurtransferase